MIMTRQKLIEVKSLMDYALQQGAVTHGQYWHVMQATFKKFREDAEPKLYYRDDFGNDHLLGSGSSFWIKSC
jgi:hypothetical protein